MQDKTSLSLNSFVMRQTLKVCLAVLIAIIINHYFSQSKEYWLVLTTFLVSMTTPGTPIRQGLLVFLNVIIALIVAAVLFRVINQWVIIDIIIGAAFIGFGWLLFRRRPLTNKALLGLLVFPLCLLLAILTPPAIVENLQARMIDSLIGFFIGTACAFLFFPVRFDREFAQGLIPTLKSLSNYSNHLKLFLSSVTDNIQQKENLDFEKILAMSQSFYPEWVYEIGFNPGLRAGFRFFLIHLDRIIESFFSIDYLLNQQYSTDLLSKLSNSLCQIITKNQELLENLLIYFETKQLTLLKDNFIDDVVNLELAVSKLIPSNLELLDISPDYVLLTALIRDLKDIREALLKLIMSLPVHLR